MAAQQHIIKRQVIDLKIDGRLAAGDIQDRVSQIYKDKLVPLLNQYLDSLSGSDSIDRINSLEIDLGSIRAEDLEFALEEKLEEQLYLANPKITSQPKKIEPPVADQPLPLTDQPDTDVVAYFLQTGTLPWWVKDDKQLAFKNAMSTLLARESTIVTSFFGSLLQDNIALKRLIYTADNSLLDGVVIKVASRYETTNPSITNLYQYLESGYGKAQFRELWWTVILTNTLHLPATAGKTTATLIRLYFDKLNAQETKLLKETDSPSATLGTFYRQQAEMLQTVTNNPEIFPVKNRNEQKEYAKQIIQLVEKEAAINSPAGHEHLYNIQTIWNKIRGLYRLEQINYIRLPLENLSRSAGGETNSTSSKSDPVLDKSTRPADISDQQSAKHVTDKEGTNSVRLDNRSSETPYNDDPDIPTINNERIEIPSTIDAPHIDVPQPLTKHNLTEGNYMSDNADSSHQQTNQPLNQVDTSDSQSLNVNDKLLDKKDSGEFNTDSNIVSNISGKRQPIQTPPTESNNIESGESDLHQHQQPQYRAASGGLVSSFSDTDRLYISNSGLVLLWPFLDRFFSSIGLINETGFVDAPSADKACMLLQYIVEGSQWHRFEPNLPLNKLLCGIDLYEPVDINIEITDDEFAAADHLLEGVIGNAPMWKSLSFDGLRSAYLQRDGILSSRDGNWLLQVQRRTYDILLDRLPWSVRVVKLPWMNNLIFVEWQ